MRHAAKSFSATNHPATIVKALNLTGYLLNQDLDGRAARNLNTLKGLIQMIPFLDSPNQNFRIESLYSLEMLSKNMEASEFREVCSRYGCLNKVAKLLYESIEDVQRKEAVFTHSGNSRLDQDGQQIESIVKPLQFSIETAISCLNLLHNYVSRNKNESSQVFREITFKGNLNCR